MYDPTVFENIKVAFENHLYDLDNLAQQITIIDRSDQMDFAILKREFSIKFSILTIEDVTAEIVLTATLNDLAEEILDIPHTNPGCFLRVHYGVRVNNIEKQCQQIEDILTDIWEHEVDIVQILNFTYPHTENTYENDIKVAFKHKIREENISEIGEFLAYVLETVRRIGMV